MKNIRVLGLMSGTSMDGLDCCLSLIKISNNYKIEYDILDWNIFTYSNSIRKLIRGTFKKTDNVLYVDQKLGKLFSNIVVKFLNGRKVDIIGSHGQTIAHHDKIFTKQIGHPKYLYYKTGIPIVYNFRSKDIKCCGNGAPLMPYLDWILFKDSIYIPLILGL